MRLTILNQFYIPDISPTAHLAASLAQHRAALGDDVTVVTGIGSYVALSSRPAEVVAAAKPRVIRIWTPPFKKSSTLLRAVAYAWFYAAAVVRLVTLRRQDAIVTLTTPPFIGVAAALHKLLHRSTKLLLWNMDCYPEVAERTAVIREGSIAARLMRSINRWLFTKVDHLVSLDSAMQELLLSQYAPVDRQLPATIIPNWESASLFPANSCHPPWQDLEALNLRGRFLVLYLGNTGFGHRFDTVIEAASLLREDPVVFLFIGGGVRWREIQEVVREKDLSNVVMRGYVPKEQTPSVMSAAHCALITLQDFALGVMSPSKLHANLAMALPVIYVGPTGSNVDDAIARYGCGVSLRHGQGAELASHIRQWIAAPGALTNLRRCARLAFEESYCDLRTLPKFDFVLNGMRADCAS